MSDDVDDKRMTVGKLITVLRRFPPDVPIAYVDLNGGGEIDAYLNEHGEVEIGEK